MPLMLTRQMIESGTVREENKEYLDPDNPNSLLGYDVYSEESEKIGSVKDFAFDEANRIRYVVVDTGFWIFGKSVIIPVGMVDVEPETQRVYLVGITRQQIDDMPAYDEKKGITEEVEYRTMAVIRPEWVQDSQQRGQADYDRWEEYAPPERLQLFEERLEVSKHREKIGEATMRKKVETRRETVEVPVQHEKLVIETRPSSEAGTTEGRDMGEETVTVPLYEDQVDVTTRRVPAQEVTMHKEREQRQETVDRDIRYETLDVEKTGDSDVERR